MIIVSNNHDESIILSIDYLHALVDNVTENLGVTIQRTLTPIWCSLGGHLDTDTDPST